MYRRKTLRSPRGLALLAGFAIVLGLGVSAPSGAEAAALKVTISGTVAQKRGVVVRAEGRDSGTLRTARTGATGVVAFSGLPADVYTVKPAKLGYRFAPEARLLTLAAASRVAATFSPVALPAVGNVRTNASTLDLRQTLQKTIVVTVTDAGGRGIQGAPVRAVSSDTHYLTVSPATAQTDALGRATFTVTAFGSIAYSNPTVLEMPAITSVLVTFTSGGWRRTPVRSAATGVTVQQGTETELWLSSGHADADGEPFTHWDGDGSVPANCARCHSRFGFLDYVADGTVNAAAPLGSTVDCLACHDTSAMALSSVTFPSGAVVNSLGHEAICMTCHQGRSSTPTVDGRVAGLPEDDINATLSFSNIHYFAAAATQFGTIAKGGYEYAGKQYDRRAPHVSSRNTCQECHNQHSLALRLDDCRTCHAGATDYAGVKDIRMAASTPDYDGDGNITEGIAAEVAGMADLLYANLRAYGAFKGFPVVYHAPAHPYFFNDANDNGVYDAGETGYDHWTPRLLKAAYNYQVYLKDPGRHGHNAKYVIQLLYDSIESLDTALATSVAAGLARNDGAHFDTTKEAFRDWDPGPVGASCARCHGGEAGFRAYVEGGYPSSIPNIEPVSRFSCETCHTGTSFGGNPPRRFVDRNIFPTFTGDPNPLIAFNDPANPDDSFICTSCHVGRQSKRSIDSYIAGRAAFTTEDTQDTGASFRNVHYLPAGGIQYGKLAGIGYEYPGKTYNVKFTHWGGASQGCAYCHDMKGSGHTFMPRLTPSCADCHTEIQGGNIETIRFDRPADYDGDGNATELLKDEIATLQAALFARIQNYANTNQATPYPIVYFGGANPYFFNDVDGSGDYSAGDTGYNHWTPRLLKAAHNYQISVKEPGAWAHNTEYMVQLLIDSIESLGGNVAGYQRPAGF